MYFPAAECATSHGRLRSASFEWDAVGSPELWRRSHNFQHHTYTNIVGKDRDVGYGILRVTPEQRWHPYYLSNPIYANLVRNLWSFAIIFCGHFPDGVATFTEEQAANESRGQWYLRQVLGSANITGSKLFHLLSGNLSHQIEHHLFPDIPAWRYSHIAEEVRDACRRYGLPYNTGPFGKQLGSVFGKLIKLALPGKGPVLGQTASEPGASLDVSKQTAPERFGRDTARAS